MFLFVPIKDQSEDRGDHHQPDGADRRQVEDEKVPIAISALSQFCSSAVPQPSWFTSKTVFATSYVVHARQADHERAHALDHGFDGRLVLDS